MFDDEKRGLRLVLIRAASAGGKFRVLRLQTLQFAASWGFVGICGSSGCALYAIRLGACADLIMVAGNALHDEVLGCRCRRLPQCPSFTKVCPAMGCGHGEGPGLAGFRVESSDRRVF